MKDGFENQFALDGLIGEGGLSLVYRVRHKSTGKILAFKKLKDNSEAGIDAIAGEHQFLRTHPHPNIIEAFDYIEGPTGPGFLLEFIEGITLDSLCGRLDGIKLASIIAEVLETALFIYNCGYIYNDYKPHNFILSSAGQFKLIDFNLVQKQDAAALHKSGTLEYLAPEVITGGQPSPCSDIYSLGVTLYELVSGRLPFIAADQDSLLKAIAETAPEPLASNNPQWDNVILQMLAKNPEDRPCSPYEVGRLLGLDQQIEALIKERSIYYLESDISAENIGEILIDNNLRAVDETTRRLVKKFLKRYSLDNEFLIQIAEWSGGKQEIIYEYLRHLIDDDYICYSEKGWVVRKPIQKDILPQNLCRRYLENLSRYSAGITNLLNWLALMSRPLSLNMLCRLSGNEPEFVKEQMRILEKAEWVVCRDDQFGLANRSAGNAIYANIQKPQKRDMHKLAAEYFSQNDPEDIEALVYHYSNVPNPEKTIEFGYKAALKWFRDDNLEQAKHYLDLAEKALALVQAGAVPIDLIAELYLLAGDVAKRAMENDLAEEKYLKIIQLAEAGNKEKLLAMAYKNMGDLYRRQQRSEESIQYTLKALDIFTRQKDLPSQAACLNNLGLAFRVAGEYAKALEHITLALQLNEELGDLTEQSKIHSNIGIIHDIMGNTSQVLASFNRSYECARAVNNYFQEMVALNNIGFFQLNSGNPQKALEFFKLAEDIARQRGFAGQQLDLESNIAWAYHKIGDFIKSAEANQKALEIALSLKFDIFSAQSSYLLARDCLAIGNYQLADKMLTQSQQICAGISNNELPVDIILSQTELELAIGDLTRCRQYLENFAKKKNSGKKQLLLGRLLSARYHALIGDASAELEFSKLIGDIAEPEFIEITVAAMIGLAEIYLQTAQYGEASAIVQMAERIDIQDVLLILRRQIAAADLFAKTRQFDASLDLLKIINKTATASGCLPELIRAGVIEADIYEICGKTANLEKVKTRLRNMFRTSIYSLPEGCQPDCLSNLYYLKKYLNLSAFTADKISVSEI